MKKYILITSFVFLCLISVSQNGDIVIHKSDVSIKDISNDSINHSYPFIIVGKEKYLQNGINIRTGDMFKIMNEKKDIKLTQMTKNARKYSKIRSICMPPGIALFIAGGVFTGLVSVLESKVIASNNNLSSYTPQQRQKDEDTFRTYKTAGFTIMGAGALFTTVGITFRIKYKKEVKKSFDYFNSNYANK